AFVAEPAAAGCTSLRAVMCSGEALGADVRDRFLKTLPGVGLHNLYGPTEASVDVTFCEAVPGSAVVPIGRPLAAPRVYVLDDFPSPAPVGVGGALCLAGVQPARGYASRPSLTADRFVASPFSASARMFRTGDVVRWNAGGALEYVGRSDDQVKIC